MLRNFFKRNCIKSSNVEEKILTRIDKLIEFKNFKIITNEKEEIKCVIKYSLEIDSVTVKSISNFIESGISKIGTDIFITALFAHNDKKIELLRHFEPVANTLYIGIISSNYKNTNSKI